MASQYSKNLKSNGFVFVNIVEDSEPLDDLINDAGEIMSVLMALKKITISKYAFKCFSSFEKEFIDLWLELTEKSALEHAHRIKIDNYCHGLKMLVRKICDLASKILCKRFVEKEKTMSFLLTKMAEMTNLFGDCKYRLMIN